MTNDIERYNTPGTKTNDFIKGFFLNIGIGAGHFALYWFFYIIIEPFKNDSPRWIITILLIGMIIFVEWFTIKHFFRTKRYIAIGMLASLLLPLLVTVFCSIVFNVYPNF